jgi:hypothetical protein
MDNQPNEPAFEGVFRSVVIELRQAAQQMTLNRRSGAITCGRVLDFIAYSEELEQMDAFVALECLLVDEWTTEQRIALLLLMDGIRLGMRNYFLNPMIITLPFKSVYRSRIRDFDMDTCYRSFGHVPDNLFRIAAAINLPEVFTLDNGLRVSGETAMLVSLYYLTHPVTQEMVADFFGLTSQPDVSRIWSEFEEFIYSQFQHLIAHIPESDDDLLIWAPFIQQFKDAIARFHVEGIDSTYYRDVICFIDGTRRHVCRPSQRPEDTARGLDTQRKSYNGHKRKHCFGIQAVTAPNGIIIALGKPFRGRRHDSFALSESRINDKLARLSAASGTIAKGYGDAAYPVLSNICKAIGSEGQIRVMNRVRTCVEWGFGKLTQKFSGVNFYAKEKIYLNRPAKKYVVAAILTNFHSCLEGSQTAFYFNCRAPTLESYAGIVPV